MGHVRVAATATQNSSATVVSVTIPNAVPSGNTLIICAAFDSSGSAVPVVSSCVDSSGNTYTTTPDVSINAGATVSVLVLRGRVTTTLDAGDTITLTLGSSRARWAIQVDEYDDLATSPLDVIASNAPASSTSLSSGTTATTAQADTLVVAAFAFGQGRTTTIPGGWSGGTKVETSAGSTDRGLQVIYKYVTSTGTQQGTLTLSSASTYVGVVATYKVDTTPPPPGTPVSVRVGGSWVEGTPYALSGGSWVAATPHVLSGGAWVEL